MGDLATHSLMVRDGTGQAVALSSEESAALGSRELLRLSSLTLAPPDMPCSPGPPTLLGHTVATLSSLVRTLQRCADLRPESGELRILRLGALLHDAGLAAFSPWSTVFPGIEEATIRARQAVCRGRWDDLRTKEGTPAPAVAAGVSVSTVIDGTSRDDAADLLQAGPDAPLSVLLQGTPISSHAVAWDRGLSSAQGLPPITSVADAWDWTRAPRANGPGTATLAEHPDPVHGILSFLAQRRDHAFLYAIDPFVAGYGALVQRILRDALRSRVLQPSTLALESRSEILRRLRDGLGREVQPLIERLAQGPTPLPVYLLAQAEVDPAHRLLREIAEGGHRRDEFEEAVRRSTRQEPLVGLLDIPSATWGLDRVLFGSTFPRPLLEVRGRELRELDRLGGTTVLTLCLPETNAEDERKARGAAVAFLGQEGLATPFRSAHLLLNARVSSLVHDLWSTRPVAVEVLRRLASGAVVSLDGIAADLGVSRASASVYLSECVRRFTAAGVRDRITILVGSDRRKLWQIADPELQNALRTYLGG